MTKNTMARGAVNAIVNMAGGEHSARGKAAGVGASLGATVGSVVAGPGGAVAGAAVGGGVAVWLHTRFGLG
jgi:hypothetical protein